MADLESIAIDRMSSSSTDDSQMLITPTASEAGRSPVAMDITPTAATIKQDIGAANRPIMKAAIPTPAALDVNVVSPTP